MAAANVSLPAIPHPYYPIEAEIAGYLANKSATIELLIMFSAGCAAIFSVTYGIVKRLRPNASTGDLVTIMWFVLCGCIHLFFEGYFAYNFRKIALEEEVDAATQHKPHNGGCIHLFFEGYFAYNFRNMGRMQDLFGQLWKEYSLSDSRYLTQDAFVLCMETITAVFWGPGSFLTAYFISVDHPLRYPFQLIVSLGQFYGDVLYYATSLFDHYILNLSYSRPEAYYFYGYFVLMNAFWIVIPALLMVQSVAATWSAFAAVNDAAKLMERVSKNGFVKKSN